MAGRVFGMGGGACGFTVMRACTSGPMVWEFPGPAKRAHQATAGEQARLDDGLVAR